MPHPIRMMTMKLGNLVTLATMTMALVPGAIAAPGGVSVNAPAPPPGPAQARAHLIHRAEKGFLDDPFALHPTMPLLAVINTDSASFARMDVVDVDEKKIVSGFALGDPQQIFERVLFTGAGQSLLVISRDPGSGKRMAQRYDDTGNPAGLVGPVSDFGLADRGDRRFFVAWDRTVDRKGSTTFTVAAHDIVTLVRVGKTRGVQLDTDGFIRQPRMKLLGWLDGYTQIAGQDPGAYDKARDIRMPDQASRYDLLRGEVDWRADILDFPGWATVTGLRARTINQWVFLQPADDQQSLTLIDGLGGRTIVDLAIPFDYYDLRSLEYHERTDGTAVAFSLAVDPLNPHALAQHKTAQAALDFYTVPIAAAGGLANPAPAPRPDRLKATHLIRTTLDDRPVQWITDGGRLAVLRKFKAFSRGGDSVEIYRLP